MRVISGKYKGKNLKCIDGIKTRPTLDRVKESLFNILQFDIEGKNVLDLFAGSGQLGLEALSRGANAADFCEMDKNAFNVLKSNLQGIDNCRVYNLDYKNFLKSLNLTGKYGIIFIDPPFEENLYTDAVNSALPFLDDKGIIVCETKSGYIFENIKGLSCFDKRKYANTTLNFFKKENDFE